MLISELPVHHKIITRLTDYGFSSLTEIQHKTILPALSGKDVMASSQTGSGKTLAFLIPSIHRLMSSKALTKQDPRALILAPTRELAKQVFVELKKLISGTRLSTVLVVGGENYNDQAKQLKRSPDIIVGTAGRVYDHLQSRHFFLNGLELLILDEADRMLDLGFSEALLAINNYADHRKRQTLLFSATLDHIEVQHLAAKLVKAPVRINIGLSTQKHADIRQAFYFADSVSHKDELLNALLNANNYNQAIVFTATREDTVRLAESLNKINQAKFNAVPLSGDLTQKQRSSVMTSFSKGQQSILVTTDLASRGLDLPNIGLVINYDLPKQADEYIHRIGRTGRAGHQGLAIALVGKKDWKSYQSIESHLSYSIQCHSHEEFPSKFAGIKTSDKHIIANTTDNSQYKTVKAPSKPVKRVDTNSGKYAGDMPIVKRKRT